MDYWYWFEKVLIRLKESCYMNRIYAYEEKQDASILKMNVECTDSLVS